jgi:hypothetical protein
VEKNKHGKEITFLANSAALVQWQGMSDQRFRV